MIKQKKYTNLIYNLSDKLNITHTLFNKYYQKGGKSLNLVYLEKDTKEELFNIKFDTIYDKYGIQIYLSNDLDNKCISISIDKENKIAYIDNLSSDLGECIYLEDFEIKNKGSFYFKMVVKMLKKYKNKLEINKITLQDNAYIICNNIKQNLTKYLLFTRGESFYGKEGFEPINIDIKNKENKLKKIIKNLKVNDINWIKILDYVKKDNNEIYQKNKKELKEIIKLLLNKENDKYIDIMKLLFNKKNGENTCYIYFILEPYLEKYIIDKFNLNKYKQFNLDSQVIRYLSI
jgi:hypothetical protein